MFSFIKSLALFALVGLTGCAVGVPYGQQAQPSERDWADARAKCPAGPELKGWNAAEHHWDWHCPQGSWTALKIGSSQTVAEKEWAKARARCPAATFTGRWIGEEPVFHCPGQTASAEAHASAVAEASTGAIVTASTHSWVAFRAGGSRENISLDQLAQMAASNTGLTINSDRYARFVGELLGRPFDGNGSFADWLRSDEVKVIPCSQELMDHVDVSRVDRATGEIGFFHRSCYPGEEAFVWVKGETVIPWAMAGCLNPVRIRGAAHPTASSHASARAGASAGAAAGASD